MNPNTTFFLISWHFPVFCHGGENLTHKWKEKYTPTACYILSWSWETVSCMFSLCSVSTRGSKEDKCLESQLLYFWLSSLVDLSVFKIECFSHQQRQPVSPYVLEWNDPDLQPTLQWYLKMSGGRDKELCQALPKTYTSLLPSSNHGWIFTLDTVGFLLAFVLPGLNQHGFISIKSRLMLDELTSEVTWYMSASERICIKLSPFYYVKHEARHDHSFLLPIIFAIKSLECDTIIGICVLCLLVYCVWLW